MAFRVLPNIHRGATKPEKDSLEISVLSSTGEIIPLNGRALSQKLSPERFWGLMEHILSAGTDVQRSRIKALWQLWAQNDLSLQQAVSIRLYRVTLLTIPERLKENPVDRELQFELKLTE